MQYYAGLDVSVKETSVCIVDKTGKVIREVKVATKPVAILAVLTEQALAIERIGLEAGPLSQWLYSALVETVRGAGTVRSQAPRACPCRQQDRGKCRELLAIELPELAELLVARRPRHCDHRDGKALCSAAPETLAHNRLVGGCSWCLTNNAHFAGVSAIRAETRATLVAAIARGRRWLAELIAGAVTSVEQMAAREECSIRQVNMTISLAFLAPELVKAAVEGRLPRGIGVTRLRDAPAEWSRQYAMLGLSI